MPKPLRCRSHIHSTKSKLYLPMYLCTMAQLQTAMSQSTAVHGLQQRVIRNNSAAPSRLERVLDGLCKPRSNFIHSNSSKSEVATGTAELNSFIRAVSLTRALHSMSTEHYIRKACVKTLNRQYRCASTVRPRQSPAVDAAPIKLPAVIAL